MPKGLAQKRVKALVGRTDLARLLNELGEAKTAERLGVSRPVVSRIAHKWGLRKVWVLEGDIPAYAKGKEVRNGGDHHGDDHRLPASNGEEPQGGALPG